MVLIIFCLFINALECPSSLFELSGSLVGIGMMPLIEWLKSSVAGLGSPGPSGVDLICNEAILMSDLVSMHF